MIAANLRKGYRPLIAGLSIAIAAAVVFYALLPAFVRAQARTVLRSEFGADVKFQSLEVSGFPRVHLLARGVAIGDDPGHPLIAVESADAWLGLLPWHVRSVILQGLAIHITSSAAPIRPKSIPALTIDEVLADRAAVEILSLHFQLAHLRVKNFNPANASIFTATVINSEPPANVELAGRLGPWNAPQPSRTPVEGTYRLPHCDLASVPGLTGTLAAQGHFQGVLERVQVAGELNVSGFALSSVGRPESLHTSMQATVDAGAASASIDAMNGSFEDSSFSASGNLRNIQDDRSRTIAATLSMPRGRLQDVLPLAMKLTPSPMTGVLRMKATANILPGEESLINRLQAHAEFAASDARFSSLNMLERLRNLSRKAEGHPDDASAGSSISSLQGQLELGHGVVTFSKLAVELEGASAHFQGDYQLASERLDLHGEVTMDAKLSQTATGPKALLLKLANPFFRSKKGGSRVPIKVAGTPSNPEFAFDLGAKLAPNGPDGR